MLGSAVPACAHPGVLGKQPLLCPLHRLQCLAFSLAVWMGAGKLKTILMGAPVGCLSCARAWGPLQGVWHMPAVGAVGAHAVGAAGHCSGQGLGVTPGGIRAVGSSGDCPGLVLD